MEFRPVEGVPQPHLGDLRSPWLLTTLIGIILQVETIEVYLELWKQQEVGVAQGWGWVVDVFTPPKINSKLAPESHDLGGGFKHFLFLPLFGEMIPFDYKVGPLPVINGVITPISRVITPVTHL